MKHFLICLMAALAFVGCTDEGTDDGGSTQPQAAITLTTTALNFATEGGSQNVSFTTSGEWTAQVINDRANDWCTIAPVSGAAGIGQLIVKASANDTTDERSASIIIKSGTEQKTIKVTQKQKDALTVTASKFEVAAEGGTVAIEVKANVDFSYAVDGASQSWIKYQTTRAMKSSTLIFDVAEIDSRDKRQGTITISSGELKEVVTIYQEGTKPAIVISKNEYVIGSEGGSVAVEVKSNVDVSVELPSDVEWLSESTTRALSTNTYYFDVAENTGYDQRSATIVFTNKANNLTEEVTITQTQKDAIVLAASEYNIDARGGALDFEIQTNVDITAKTSATWIEQVATRGLESKMLFFDIAANDAQEAREGTITLSGGNATQTIIVKQAANICPEDEIWYISSNGEIVEPYKADAFGASIVSNTYVNGKGIIKFNQAVTSIGETAFYYCSSLTSITIPNSVTSIGEDAFRNCSKLTSINIPDSVTSIGDYAFYNCSSLTSINIPDSVTSIGYYAFSHCSSLREFNGKFASTDSRCLIVNNSLIAFAPAGLTEYTIPDSVTSIGDGAFSGCSNLTSINIPISVTTIGSWTFYDCSSLISITIPDSVTSIGDYTFYGCSSLKEFKGKFASTDSRCLIVNNSLKAFAPAGLTEYTIPDSVTSIGSGAFRDCSKLTSINIPDSVTSICSYAFEGCSSLTSITIPNNVTSIGSDAFMDCSSLTSITIPDSVTSIGYRAFYGCSSLTSITIPNSVTYIGSYAFKWCSSLQNIICNPTNPPTGGEEMFNNISSSAKIYVPTGSGDAYKAAEYWSNYADMIVEMGTETPPNNPDPSPEDPDTLPDNEIWYTSADGGIVAPNNADAFGASIVSNTYVNGKGIIKFNQAVTSIGYYAFSDCSSLTSITIPNSVTSIGGKAFSYCSSLTSINIPDSVTSIGNDAFSYCSSLTSITIPDSVTSIGDGAFSNCSSLKEFKGKFASTDSRCLIINNSLIAFAPAGLTEYTIPNSVTSIGRSAFCNCPSLTSITIPNSVTSIGRYALCYCSSLTSITIPDSVTSIGDGAFYNCSSLKEFKGKFASTDSRCLIINNSLIAFAPAGLTEYTIPNSVTSIGDSAFEYCSSLTSINIPDSVTSIGSYAFMDCSSLTSINIPNTVTSIGSSAFEDCSSLTSINIPNSVTSIKSRAFYNCSSLTSITIPNSVTSIGYLAFRNCSSLTSITIPNSVTSIGEGAFKRCSSLQNIICNPTNPPTGGEEMFDGISSSAKIYVPTGSGDAYKAATYWSNYKDMIVEM